nr:ABC transporter substrate-binding protein [uncultured Desulfuromonas sp.]
MKMTMKSSFWILSLLLLLILLVASLCRTSNDTIKIAIHHWIGYESLTLCEQEHLINQNLVSLIHSASLSDSAALVRKDLVDGAALTFDEVFQLRQEGIPLTVILIFDISSGADLLLTRPEIHTLQDLKHKTIGMESSVLSQILLSAILEKAGLTTADVDLRYGIVANHEQLWQQPDIDALITYLPLPESMAKSCNILFDSRQIPDTVRDVLAIRTDRLEKFRPALKHILACHFAILNKFTQEDPDTLHRIAALLGFSVKQTEDVLRKIRFPCLECNYTYLSSQETQTQQSLNRLITTMQQANILPPTVAMEHLVDHSFLPDPRE